jgi:uncharacterized membrane protein
VTAGPDPRVDDVGYRLESTISRLLVVGTYVAIGLVLIGVIGMLAEGIDPLSHVATPAFALDQIPAQVRALEPVGFLWLGLVAVLALPLGRVIVAGVGFLVVRDVRLALVSLAVLLVVTASILAAIGLER